jgi:peptide/nickel transport system substrate-binding protein
MVKADARGKILEVGYRPGESATLVRNPKWNPATDTRPAFLHRIEIHIGGDPNVIGRQVLYGSHTVENDTPTAAIVKLAYQHYHDQLVAVPGAGIYYIALNNKQGPFSNINARKAPWAALNREAMIDASGGPLTGALATHFIYPGTNGYSQAGGNAGPADDYNRTPSGNMALAARYMKAAGYSTGRYTGDGTVTVVGVAGDPYAPIAELVNQTLRDLGFTTRVGLFTQAIMFSKFCGTPAQEIDVCPNAGWTRDFADPQTNLDPLFAGYNIIPTGNTNIGQVNNAQINRAMKAAEQLISLPARARAWAHIDRTLVDTAAAIPWEFIRNPTIESADVRGINDLWNAGYWDYSYTSLK